MCNDGMFFQAVRTNSPTRCSKIGTAPNIRPREVPVGAFTKALARASHTDDLLGCYGRTWCAELQTQPSSGCKQYRATPRGGGESERQRRRSEASDSARQR
ncbi:hypothetical protein TELCIR_16942 [Teladorsagia circumcincta]|uniref:Uncharacterized protein n=1 Tax=Teladorsagia circumcincta TaxID=45464 RepID=A0A2G9TU72_TELCI|nr:hypothetical protein TELCIR_16942 [Teladorsagia circumcincta]